MEFCTPGARIVGRYEVASRPLRGGMGIVYLCFDRQAERPVALKTWRPEFLPNRDARDRFLREGTTWVQMGNHPHIVRAYGVERVGDGQEVYLVLELVAKDTGRTDASLRSWLEPGKPLPLEQALLFGLQIARGMAHATAVVPGFVHRDLKPENVLVGSDRLPGTEVNRVRLTDFGLAAVFESSGTRESNVVRSSGELRQLQQVTRGIVGTPMYMAPEQWKGERVNVQTDMYALGCVLYEMLVGRRPVRGNSLAALKRAHCGGEVRPLPAGLPGAVRTVVTRCMALESTARYASWEELEEAVAATYVEVTGRAAPKPWLPQVLSWAERVAVGAAYNALGLSYLDIGKAEVALGYFERAWGAGQAEGERHLEAAALGNLGLAYARLGEAQRAIRYHEQALAIAHEIGDWRRQGSALGNLGNAYFQLGDVRRAIGYHEQALAIAREIGDRRWERNALGNLGNAYFQLGDVRRAIGYYEQVLAIAREIGDRRWEGNALDNLGSAYFRLGEARRAIRYHEQALEVAREIGDRHGEGTVLGNLGVAYSNLGEARQALSFHEQAQEVAREIGDRRGEGAALGNLGNAYFQLGDLRRAIRCYAQALAIRHEIGDMMGMATDSFNMALLLAQQGRLAEALPLAQQAAEIWEQIGSPYAKRAQQLTAQIRAALR